MENRVYLGSTSCILWSQRESLATPGKLERDSSGNKRVCLGMSLPWTRLLLCPPLGLHLRNSPLSLPSPAPSSQKKLFPRLGGYLVQNNTISSSVQSPKEEFEETENQDNKRGRKETQKSRVNRENGRKWEGL